LGTPAGKLARGGIMGAFSPSSSFTNALLIIRFLWGLPAKCTLPGQQQPVFNKDFLRYFAFPGGRKTRASVPYFEVF
jgi:hypothetical protein